MRTILPTYATNQSLLWKSSNTAIATVDPATGIVTAQGGGKTCICAYAQDGSGRSSCCEVTVVVPVESVTIDTSELTLRVGEYDYLKTTICPSDATNKEVRWNSSDPSIAYVDYYSGRVEARAEGTTTIFAIAQDGTDRFGTCTITVYPPIAVQSVTISPESKTMVVGDSEYLSAIISPSNATNKSITWCSSNPNIAEVNDSTGEITAKMVGTTLITATTDNGHSAECHIKVEELIKRSETEETIFGAVINDVIGAQAYRVALNMTYHITKIENGKAYIAEISAFTKYDKGNTADGLNYPDITIGRLKIGSDIYTMQTDDRDMWLSPYWKWDAKVIYLNKWYDIGTSISLLSIVMLDASLFPYRDVELETQITTS